MVDQPDDQAEWRLWRAPGSRYTTRDCRTSTAVASQVKPEPPNEPCPAASLPHRLPPHRRQGRLVAAGRFRGRPAARGLACGAGRGHRLAAQGQARRPGGLVGRDRARPLGAEAAEGRAQARGSARPPPPSARSRWRASGRRCSARHGITAGQILVTLGDTEERRRYLNARSTIDKLLEWKSVPVINENDTVATNEIRYGDNDRLGRPRRHHDERGPAGAALRHRRALRRAARPATPPPSWCRWSSASRRRSKRWPARPAPNFRAAAW